MYLLLIDLRTTQDLERRRIDAIRVAKYMDVMDSPKVGEPHPRVALAARAYKKKDIKVRLMSGGVPSNYLALKGFSDFRESAERRQSGKTGHSLRLSHHKH